MSETYNRTGLNDKKRNKKNASNAINAGGALVIVIFVVLCLTIFGMLSFATSFADKKLADKNLLAVSQFYEADTKAEEILAQSFDALSSAEGITADGAVTMLEDAGIKDVIITEKSDERIEVSYDVEISDMQTLKCTIDFYIDSQEGTLCYEIQKWQTVITGDLSYDDDLLDLWSGDDYED